MTPPLVTILIATRGRPPELAATLTALRKQTYPSIECLVIDDASPEPLQELVHSIWPEATVIREEKNLGQCACRSKGFKLAKGEFILQLDDDACFTKPGDLATAVRIIEAHPEAGLLTFQIFNGQTLPENLALDQVARYGTSFIGCGALLRKAAAEAAGGYREFFGNEWEEDEFSLRLIKAGWTIYIWPEILIHHRVSPLNRRSSRTWMRGLRNKLWAMVMHFPAWRLPADMSWALGVGLWDSIRLFRFHRYFQALFLFLFGLPRALSLRSALTGLDMRRLDAVRFRTVRTLAEWNQPEPLSRAEVWTWFNKIWMRRPRQRSIWDRRPGDTGLSQAVKFAHEHIEQAERPRNQR
jgi:GT2 family glycosyltransferase